jgi:hypothetical protein
MSKSDRVLGTPPTNMSAKNLNSSVDSSRRLFLVQAAGAAAGGAALGAVLPLPLSAATSQGDADPILAAIAAHKLAFANVISAICVQDVVEDEIQKEKCRRSEDVNPRWIEAQKVVSLAWRAEESAAIELVIVRPTTVAGTIALLNYAISADRDGETWPQEVVADDGETIRSWHHFLVQNLAELLPGLMRESA